MLQIYGKFECKIWAVIESGAIWEGYNIKLRTIFLKVQNCFQVLTGGHAEVIPKHSLRILTFKRYMQIIKPLVVGPESLYIQDLRIHGSRTGQSRFSFWSFNFLTSLRFLPKKAQKVQKVILFFIWKGEEISLDFTIWVFQKFLKHCFGFLEY